MTDLRALLGHRYDDVIQRALAAVDAPHHGYQVTRGNVDGRDVDAALSAALPDLLAGAWDEGRKVGLRQADWEYGVTPYPMPELANPYRTERADHE